MNRIPEERRDQQWTCAQDRRVEMRHRGAVGVSDDPLSDAAVPKVVCRASRIGPASAKTSTAPAGVTPIGMISHKGTSFDVTTAAVDDVARADQITTETFGVCGRDAGDAILDDAVVADVLRHDRRDTARHLGSSVPLAAARAALAVAPAPLTGDTESRVLPVARGRTD